jgi:hypothetical protein
MVLTINKKGLKESDRNAALGQIFLQKVLPIVANAAE